MSRGSRATHWQKRPAKHDRRDRAEGRQEQSPERERKTAGLTKAVLSRVPLGSPYEMTAHGDGIRLRVDTAEGGEVTVLLQPRHIERVVAMAADWWSTTWADLHETQARE